MTSARQPDPAAPLVIVNRRAARLANPARRAEIVDAVRHAVRARTAAEPAIVDGDQEAAMSALDAAVAAPLIVAVGGDGTVRDVISSRVGRTRPVAIVPGGTGNVLAAALGIRGIGPALDAIRHGGVRAIDVGEARWGAPGATDADGRTDFLVACGMGLDARVMAAAAHEWKRRLGFGAYVGAGVRELARLETADFHVTADGVTFRLRGLLILVANLGELVPGRVGPRRPIDPADGSSGPDRRRRGGCGLGHPVCGSAAAEDRRDPRRHHPHPGPVSSRGGGSAATDPDRRRPSPGGLARGDDRPGGPHRRGPRGVRRPR